MMWEELKVYQQLDKKDVNSTFKDFGKELLSLLTGYNLKQTISTIKISRIINELEQAVFIEKQTGDYNLKVRVCIKPAVFYRRHKFTMLNIVPLGDILNNHRRTFYPLTQEWKHLAVFLSIKISNEVEQYLNRYNSYDEIINNRHEIEPSKFDFNNKYELLIYASIKTKKKALLSYYIDKKLSRPVMQIGQSELLKPDEREIDEISFLQKIKELNQQNDFEGIEKELINF